MKKLYRSRRDKKLFGLCGGVAEMLNVDATLLRILLIVLTVFTSGAMILVYILAGLVVPKEPPVYNGFGPSGYNGYNGGFGMPPHGGQGYGGPYTNTPPPQPGPTGSFTNWQNTQGQGQAQGQSASNLDSMMDDLEKKALRKEIEELRAKLSKLEKGDV